MVELSLHLVRDPKLYLFDFDGVVTTEAEDVALKAQTVTVFAAIANRFDKGALKMVRLAGQAIYDAGGTLQLGPLLFHAAQLLKPARAPIEPTLSKLIDACVGNIDYRTITRATPIIHQGLNLLKAQRTEVAILTNGVRENVFNVLGVKGLTDICPREHVFDAISTRDEAGKLHPKPDAVGIRLVLAELGIRPEECVFVDNSRKNVRAAKSEVGCAGAIYIGNKLKPKDHGLIDHIAPSLEALMIEIVAALTSRA
jgi:FMN phosphatase YigB (HAD superfamily)